MHSGTTNAKKLLLNRPYFHVKFHYSPNACSILNMHGYMTALILLIYTSYYIVMHQNLHQPFLNRIKLMEASL